MRLRVLRRRLLQFAVVGSMGIACVLRGVEIEEALEPSDASDEPIVARISDAPTIGGAFRPADLAEGDEGLFLPVNRVQPVPLDPAAPQFDSPTRRSETTRDFADEVFGTRREGESLLSRQRRPQARSNADVVFGSEGKFRATTDAGNLLGKSQRTTGVIATERSPIITDTRIHGSHVGQLVASGSYWFPVRQDLDTMMSKIDSRLIADMAVIKGPFAARYGPGFDFVDIDLLTSPRYADGPETHGSTSLEYKSNGEQWYGRQTVWGGGEDYGFRVGYGNRSGSSYHDAEGTEYPSSYHSQDLDLALGYDLTPDRHLEFSYLRLDQSNVLVPTQLLDISFLVTDAFELTYTMEDHPIFDLVTIETWYNQTRFGGNANLPAKRQEIPFLEQNITSIVSDGHNSSAGFSAMGDIETETTLTTLGADLRYLQQEVNQYSVLPLLAAPYLFGNNSTPEVNGPMPKSHTANPGLFLEHISRVNDDLTISAGGRGDVVEMNASTVANEVGGLAGPLNLYGPNMEFPFVYNPNGDPVNLPDGMGGIVTVPGIPAKLDDLLLGKFHRTYGLGMGYVNGAYDLDETYTATAGIGFGMRAPTMTELYSLQHISTIFPQQTLSILFGNPNLKPEKRYEVDLGLRADDGPLRGGINTYAAFIEDYITFDALATDWFVYQTVNTNLALLTGFDAYGEADVTDTLTAFGNMFYVSGRDLTRTSNPAPGFLDRPGMALRSMLTGRDHEPLPNISPMEARVGGRLHDASDDPNWGLELSARIVDAQQFIASSLGEMTTPGFTIWDLRGYARAGRGVTINAGVENLTNKMYQEHLDPHGRVVPFNPFLPATAASLGTVYRPGVNFYVATEIVY